MIREQLDGRMLLFGASNLIVAEEFDHSIVMNQGRMTESASGDDNAD